MPDTVPNLAETVLEVISPDGVRRYVRVTQMPFLIGRGAETGNHLWADRFDKPVADLFDMQDEIVARLANALNAQLISAEARLFHTSA